MKWEELLILLKAMAESKHVSMGEPVKALIDGCIYRLDLLESLTVGYVVFVQDISWDNDDEEEEETE